MTKIFVVESDPSRFEHWNHPKHGLSAHLRSHGVRWARVNIERLSSVSDLFGLAQTVKGPGELPGQALVLQGIQGSDLSQSPHTPFEGRLLAPPDDYREGRDPEWTYATDEKRPLAPHARLIASRLVRKGFPSVSFSPEDAADRDYPGGVAGQSISRELFKWRPKRGGGEKLVPDYGRFLQLANTSLACRGLGWMSIVDAMGHDLYVGPLRDKTEPIEGADITLNDMNGSNLVPKRATKDMVQVLRAIEMTALLISGTYPNAEEYKRLGLSLPSLGDVMAKK